MLHCTLHKARKRESLDVREFLATLRFRRASLPVQDVASSVQSGEQLNPFQTLQERLMRDFLLYDVRRRAQQSSNGDRLH